MNRIQGNLILTFAIASLGVGCAPKNNLDIIIQTPAVSLDENLKRAKTYCKSQDQAECHTSVGFVLTVTTDGTLSTVGQCTGFLVAADIVATNSHCIPDELKANPKICPKTIGIKFPTSGAYGEEIAVCKELIKHSEIVDDNKNPEFLRKSDYALFRIATPSRRPAIAISRSGLDDGMGLTLMAVDPIMGSNYAEGRLTAKRCKSIKGSQHLTDDTHPLSAVGLVFGPECSARKGNSGSPALNGDGRAVGLLHGGVPAEYKVGTGIPKEQTVSHFENPAHVTNFACLDLPGVSNAPAIPGSCDAENVKRLGRFKSEERGLAIKKSIEYSAREIYAKWLAEQAPKTFKYKSYLKIDATKMTAKFDTAAQCVMPDWAWTRTKVTRPAAVATLDVPRFDVKTKYDPYLRIQRTVELNAAAASSRIVTFDFTQLSAQAKHIGSVRAEGTETPFVSRNCTNLEAITDEALVIEFHN